ncbi:hypothetical protein XELAEV_18006063mg [Xenopus laevis]|uniref:Uncharacterized protein n=1 Tax=Xenopus laevis TaxID=8355 RepID=A0A974I3H0_XENLA|nr:hypothetical protein XELAEV_18006063mg [Xenopus laevis]
MDVGNVSTFCPAVYIYPVILIKFSASLILLFTLVGIVFLFEYTNSDFTVMLSNSKICLYIFLKWLY